MPVSYSQQTFEHMLWAVHNLSNLFVRGDDTLFIEFCFRDKKVEKAIWFAHLSCDVLEAEMSHHYQQIAHAVLRSL